MEIFHTREVSVPGVTSLNHKSRFSDKKSDR